MGLVLPEFKFEPITSKVEGSKCVPIVLDMKDIYNVYVAKDTTRRYKQEQLPSFILSKIIIAKEDGLEDVSWKISDSIYVIVLTKQELSELKGTRIDTRKESQRES